MQSSDWDLMEAVKRRDADAFETITARYGEEIRMRLLRMVRDESTVHDLWQETCVRLWERASQWSGKGSLRAYLLKIAVNLALNHIETIQRRRELPLRIAEAPPYGEEDQTYIPHWLIDPNAQPGLDTEQAERTRLLRNAKNALPPEKRAVFLMADQDDMSMRDIADMLNIPIGTAKSRLHYAIKHLMGQTASQKGIELSAVQNGLQPFGVVAFQKHRFGQPNL